MVKTRPTHGRGEPHINGSQAIMYQTWSLCQQDRISKERRRQMTEEMVEDAYAHPHQELPELKISKFTGWPIIPQERYGRGSVNPYNNRSSEFKMSFGTKSWAGAYTTQHRTFHGPVSSTAEFAGPMGLRHQLASMKSDGPPDTLRRTLSLPQM
eukprot:TRINITY_DN63673_c0_g1_i1.p1 TRINITY_DN63673_c0_g1~~TRINITY_DN63673_c0_g1_i1.p1  ORF type:complete len:154 (+),score=14.33 TRINITY_DN63673_c0_g1_i1:136-597(+)